MSNGFSVGAERVCLIWTAVVKNLPHNPSRRAENVMDSSTRFFRDWGSEKEARQGRKIGRVHIDKSFVELRPQSRTIHGWCPASQMVCGIRQECLRHSTS